MAGSPSSHNRGRDGWVVWATLAWWLGWIFLTPVRGLDPDELEHLHAAFCVWQGDLPYRDFFEHHAPALYWLAWPVFALVGPALHSLWLLRAAMWLLTGLTALLLARAPACPASAPPSPPGIDPPPTRPAASPGWAGLFFLGTTITVAKGLEFRPDVPAACLLACVALLVQGLPIADPAKALPFRPGRRWLLVALSAGLATLFTQKAIVPLAALTAALGLETLVTRRWRAGLVQCAALPLGVASAWAVASLGFASAHAARPFWDSTIAQLWRWPIRSGTWPHLRPTLIADGWFWALALLGAAHALSVWWRPAAHATSPLPPPAQPPAFPRLALATLFCLLSLVAVKATFPQYYLLWFPWLALLASRGWELTRDRLWPAEAPPSPPPAPTARLATSAVATLLAGLVGLSLTGLLRGLWLGPQGGLAALFTPSPTRGIALLLLACGGTALAWLVLRSRARLPALALALALGQGLARHANLIAWHNHPQVAAIDQLHARVPPTGRVFDGFTGWGALRPHAFYYWWLNEFSLPLIPPDRLEADLLLLFRTTPPDAVLDDVELQRLPASVRREIEANYRPVHPPPLRLRDPVWRHPKLRQAPTTPSPRSGPSPPSSPAAQ